MLYIKKIKVVPFEAPLNQPFRIATGQHTLLSNVRFMCELSDGTKGFGEAGIASHITGESVAGTAANLERTGGWLVGKDVSGFLAISCRLHDELPANKSAVAAVEMALFDALSRSMKLPLWKLFGASCACLSTDITIVLGPLEEAIDSCRRFYARGFRKFKIKIGGEPGLDLARVAAAAGICKKSELYLDANQAYTPNEILRFLKELKKKRITPQLLEQPVARDDWDGLKEVARKSRVPVCADESASSIKDCLRIIREKAVPAVNIKLMKTGLIHSREIALLCRAAGIELMIGAMMESSLSTMASAHLAAGMGCFRYIDIDTPFFIKPGFDRNPFLSAAGVYTPGKVREGIGIIPRRHAA